MSDRTSGSTSQSLSVVGPARTWNGNGDGVQLSGTRALGQTLQVVVEVLVHVPVGAQHGQRAAVGSAERTGEAGLPERDPIQHLSAVGHP